MSFRIICAIAILALAGCATRQEAPSADRGGVVIQDAASSGSESSNVDKSSVTTAAMLAEEQMKAVEPSVYFDYDKFEIKDNYQGTVSAFAEYMRTHPDSDIRIEGNCDERGTIEYNLALGQKRAEAVSTALQAVGVTVRRIETISNGEEIPRNTSKSEAGYSANRRADLIIIR
jgi:peptidoglycan-associated lipoprotein